MAFNIFKKENEPVKTVKEVKKTKAVDKAVDLKSNESPKDGAPETAKNQQGAAGLNFNILKSPRITEKATYLMENSQYVFNINLDANKIEVKKAVEKLYGVEVENVNIIHSPSKKRRFGGRVGKQGGYEKGYKKAIVKIKKGQKIEVVSR